ncbi:MAG: hypothetical protein JWM68_1406 [Verrucomicrobiales bacterium]|nr:hypothetical protein [Verrucomicrobiales bacterium]
MSRKTILVVSDIHYACEAEQARHGQEFRGVKNAFTRALLHAYRDYFWLKNPTRQNHLLDQFFLHATGADYVVANGDFSCNTGFIGVGDDAACQSAQECLGKLRRQFAPNFSGVFGDHELGKTSMAGNLGGMRLTSWHRAIIDLKLQPFWSVEFGDWLLIGVVSSLIALPVFEAETLPEEREEWRRHREEHLGVIRKAFTELKPNQRVLLFCHDPTALPFLWEEEAVRSKLPQVEHTIIGHLHSPLFLWKSRLLAGMPVIRGLGVTVHRYSQALHRARHWREFRVTLCPSLHGIELLKDGGFLKITLDANTHQTGGAHIERQKILR